MRLARGGRLPQNPGALATAPLITWRNLGCQGMVPRASVRPSLSFRCPQEAATHELSRMSGFKDVAMVAQGVVEHPSLAVHLRVHLGHLARVSHVRAVHSSRWKFRV